MNCLEDKIGIKSQSRSSSCFDGFMKGGQAPDSIKGFCRRLCQGVFVFEISHLYDQFVPLEWFPWVLEFVKMNYYLR